MTANSRDADRRATYEAEAAAFDGTDLESPVPFDLLVSIADDITTSTWWSGPPVHVRQARRDSATSSARCLVDGDPSAAVELRLAADGCTLATLAHELAHALVGAARGHDGVFRRAELDVIAVITNLDVTARRRSDHVDALGDAFTQFGLDVAARRWPDPTMSNGPEGFGGRAIAL